MFLILRAAKKGPLIVGTPQMSHGQNSLSGDFCRGCMDSKGVVEWDPHNRATRLYNYKEFGP